MTYALWIVQGLLAVTFLAVGLMKLFQPSDFAAQMGVPVPVVVFIGIVEVLGGIGVVLPGITRIRPALVPLAAAGLVVLMVLATAFNIATGYGQMAPLTIVIAALAAFVSYGRWRAAPHRDRAAQAAGRTQVRANRGVEHPV
jgi:putative oxidoreductase